MGGHLANEVEEFKVQELKRKSEGGVLLGVRLDLPVLGK
jgi:hypothetical protein